MNVITQIKKKTPRLTIINNLDLLPLSQKGHVYNV